MWETLKNFSLNHGILFLCFCFLLGWVVQDIIIIMRKLIRRKNSEKIKD